jgi:tetratricopeptide (TPR) repeat protein
MHLRGDTFYFRHQKSQSNPYRMLLWVILIVGSLFLLKAINQGDVKPLLAPTSTPTRASNSFALEGETHFNSGNLDLAMKAYQAALQLEPNNSDIWAELARIQVYSSTLLTTDAETITRLEEALTSINKAVEIAPEDSTVHAVRAFVLDWNANSVLAGNKSEGLLAEAERSAVRAITLDNQNTLALAYYAEILLDELKWLQAQQYIKQALEKDSTLMDVHRINAYIQESMGDYNGAIKEYQKAIELTPNLTFLYLRAGSNFRQLRNYDMALEYYTKAARINENLGVQDPIPYIAIARTYSQLGEFFIASRNIEKALRYSPTSPDVYAQLGIIYYKGRNYEGATVALKCAIKGCTADESCEVRKCDAETDPKIEIQGMPLTANTLVYYYTYGSVLAGLHTPTSETCNEALQILNEVRDAFKSDETTMTIVQESIDICASFGVRIQ